jgi:hypothetical protein
MKGRRTFIAYWSDSGSEDETKFHRLPEPIAAVKMKQSFIAYWSDSGSEDETKFHRLLER